VSEKDDRELWDRSGPEDPDVARLEKMLAPLAHDAPLRPKTKRPWLVASAGALALAALIALAVRNPKPPSATLASSPCGAPSEGSYVFHVSGPRAARCGDEERHGGWIPVGGVLETPQGAKATVEIAKLGTVALEPGSKLRLLPAKGETHTLDLEKGTLHARIDAPPRLFVVKTPHTDAVDLGCEYQLSIEADGSGRLSVAYGSVSLEREDRAPTLVTQGASCRIGRNGPGTPLSDATSEAMKKAAAELDDGDATAFDRILRAADEQDTLTLWHVMRRKDPEERGRAYDRLATLVKPPAGAPRAAVVAGERSAIAAYRDALKERWFRAPHW
jgi:hypothetical protein